MIRLVELSKTFFVAGEPHVILDRANVTIPSGASVGLIGRNGTGKSSLLRMIAGTLRPTEGKVEIEGSVSWPVGFKGGFHGDLTGAQNARFVARVYGVDTDALVEFVAGFAELGHHLYEPIRFYSEGMRARLAFAVSMGIPFDTYLIDEVLAVGDGAFREKSQQMLLQRLETSGAIVVNHHMKALRRTCTAGLVLEKGQATWFNDIEEAIAVHEERMAA